MNAKNILLTATLCAGFGLAPLLAQTGKQQEQTTPTPSPSPMNMKGMGMEKMKQQSSPTPSSSPMTMMGMNVGKMMSNWKDQDAELDKLVAEMNSAPSDKKIDAIAAVVSKLVEQRKARHERMQKMMTEAKKEMMKMGCMMMNEDQ